MGLNLHILMSSFSATSSHATSSTSMYRALTAGDLNPHLPGATSRGTFCTVLAGASPVGIESGEDNLYLPTPYILELVLSTSGLMVWPEHYCKLLGLFPGSHSSLLRSNVVACCQVWFACNAAEQYSCTYIERSWHFLVSEQARTAVLGDSQYTPPKGRRTCPASSSCTCWSCLHTSPWSWGVGLHHPQKQEQGPGTIILQM